MLVLHKKWFKRAHSMGRAGKGALRSWNLLVPTAVFCSYLRSS